MVKLQMNRMRTSPGRAIATAQPKNKKAKPSDVDVDVAKYYMALTDPFAEAALGARVPDQYSSHTVTQVVKASLTVSVNSSGVAAVVILPNPLVGVYLPSGQGSDFSSVTYGDGTVIAQSIWGISPTALSSKLDTYRIVGYGVRVTGMSSMTNCAGKFIMGSYPVTSKWLTKDLPVGGNTMATNAGFTKKNLDLSVGIPYNGASISGANWTNLPGSRTISALEATEQIIAITPKLSSPEALNFRDSGDSNIGTDSIQAALGLVTVGDSSYLNVDGHEAAYIYYTGGVASTSTFDVEVIYHLEGRPYISAGTQSVSGIVPAGGASVSPVKPIGMLKAVQAAAREPTVKFVVEQAAGFIHPLLGRLASQVLKLF